MVASAIAEIVVKVVPPIFTNDFNRRAETDLGFPRVLALGTSSARRKSLAKFAIAVA